jgi:hypothetical protein
MSALKWLNLNLRDSHIVSFRSLGKYYDNMQNSWELYVVS